MKRKILRILSALIALLLIILVLSFSNSLIGNPITKSKAAKDIRSYLSLTYPNTDYRLQKVTYNFKFSEYNGKIISPSSKDSHFTITWRKNKVIYDDFNFRVVERQNTLDRYESEIREHISSLINSIPNSNINRVYVHFSKEFYETDDSSTLELDSDYDKSMNIPIEVSLSCSNSSPTLSDYATILEQVHEKISSNGYAIVFYSMDNPSSSSSLYLNTADVSPSDIESGSLLSLLDDALNHPKDDVNIDKKEDSSSYGRKLHVIYTKR